MNLGTIIKNSRKQKGQTQLEFATSCGITQTYLSQIENNNKEPNLATLKEISNKLEIPLPPFAEQQRIVAKIEELFLQLDIIEESL